MHSLRRGKTLFHAGVGCQDRKLLSLESSFKEEENDSLMDETLNDNSLDTIESTLDPDDSRDSGMYSLK
ncbi:hypothetical protein TNCV_576711 [Trichonephila clavipes]|nr:hypothetical protein TNCV_576711 [Trichonephila clavipes]